MHAFSKYKDLSWGKLTLTDITFPLEGSAGNPLSSQFHILEVSISGITQRPCYITSSNLSANI